jgi:hypothetical protein
MDERRTLSLLAWIMGSLLAAILVLSAIALAETATADAAAIYTFPRARL